MPQLKKPITSIEQMVCERCIFYQKPPLQEDSCINPDGNNWDQGKDDCCSKGMWLYYGKWIDSEERDQLHTMDYADAYLRLAELNELPRNPR